MFYNTVVLVISTTVKMVQMEYYTHNSGENHINHNQTDISLNSLERKFIYVFQETVPHWGEWVVGSRVLMPKLHS